jgi:hypothetical protein
MDDETTQVISPDETNEVVLDHHDTPTSRATINQLAVDELDAMLTVIRERRLERVQRLEAIARVKSDEAQLITYMKYERAYKVAKRILKRCEDEEVKAEKAIHKCRLLVMAMQLEVGMEEEC